MYYRTINLGKRLNLIDVGVKISLSLFLSLTSLELSDAKVEPSADPLHMFALRLFLNRTPDPSTLKQAVVPVLIGAARPATEGGGFAAFPFYRFSSDID